MKTSNASFAWKKVGLVSILIGLAVNSVRAGDLTNYARAIIGSSQTISDPYGSILGGGQNTNAGLRGTIGGGEANFIQLSESCFIGAGFGNIIQSNAQYSTIAGGGYNFIGEGAFQSTIGGGVINRIEEDAYESVIAGGVGGQMEAYATYACILGGGGNHIGTNSTYTTVGGGWDNFIDRTTFWGTNWRANASVISGGWTNYVGVDSFDSFIGGGFMNIIAANAPASVVSGGWQNNAAGSTSVIPGGAFNATAGYASFAAGYRAKANHEGSFVWGDNTEADVSSAAAKDVTFRCNGGVRFLGTGAGGNQVISWAPGATGWTVSSDRNLKENFTSVNRREILDKITSLPMNEWNFKGHEQRHVGPMAQDFHERFCLGGTETTIDTGDLHGVTLVAIQGLDEEVKANAREQAAQLNTRDARISQLERELSELKQMFKASMKTQLQAK
jgi:hypothetical protein